MKLYNKSGNGLQHVLVKNGKIGTYTLLNGQSGDIPDEIATKWLKIKGVEKYIAPADLEKAATEAKAEAEAKVTALENENEKLKTELAELKTKVAKTDVKAEAEAKDTKKTNK